MTQSVACNFGCNSKIENRLTDDFVNPLRGGWHYFTEHKMQGLRQELPGRGSNIVCVVVLLLGCAPILLDLVVPPWGIPAAIFAIWFVLKQQGQNLATVGLIRPPNGWPNTFMLGIGGAFLILVLGEFLFPPLINLVGLSGQDLSGYESIEGNNGLLAIFLTVSWTTAGFGEEMIFRGFLMAGLARCFGASKVGWAAAIVISSMLFGLIHVNTGAGAVPAFSRKQTLG